MKKIILTLIIGSFFTYLCKAQENNMTTEKEKISYLVGYSMGADFKTRVPYDFDLSQLTKGLETAFKGEESGFSEEETNAILQKWQGEMMQEEQSKTEVQSSENKVKGQEFLAKNAKEKGVKVTESGLQYKVITEGKGAKPLATDNVKVHYVGTLLDGTEFDSSVARGEPITFPLNGVIKGWTEGLQLMTVGSKYTFFIPSELGYGDRAVSVIPAGSTLVFEVELLEINPAE